ncbi:DNA starvation/stationary phase protection protein Dps [Paracoccus aerodenitrificans]|uniref:DNA starvation/stationary phase protection protein Dps n=1 Tax=Paracoccus aerodenitrificans TaxID=3017781 RepID=UPI0022F037D8|nr:DNA starvation/stationary phase protection protein Dps [Paracoccus aerodenitrificans]WBU65259.1 DNA starvation/stationary phase protection protein Dps [Paracoccus aerodenitrificans]
MSVDLKSLTDNARKTSIEVLNGLVADGIAVSRALKQAHWNVKGPGFIGFHELLDSVKDHVDAGVDELAERVQQLDGTAIGTIEEVAKNSSLKAYPTDLVALEDHAKAVAEILRDYGGKLRQGIETTDDAGDPNTADILTSASNDVDKDTWFVSSYLG